MAPPQQLFDQARPPPMPATSSGEIEEIVDEVGREYARFKSFEIVPSRPSDHRYSMETPTQFLRMRASKKIMEGECLLLKKHIPGSGSIFVRAYESRADLMRAAFVGPPGSDLEHCLLFFDISFPPDYPNAPPSLHYLSYGVDTGNPNLRPDGRVCLDFGATWYNRLKRLWPSSNGKPKQGSKEINILRILCAVRDLVSYRSGPPEKHNARAFARCCEMMTRVIRKPPEGFELFVMGHFRERAHPILLEFKKHDYQDETMIDLFKRMFRVFERNGAYCKHHLDFLKSRKLGNQDFNIDDEEMRFYNRRY